MAYIQFNMVTIPNRHDIIHVSVNDSFLYMWAPVSTSKVLVDKMILIFAGLLEQNLNSTVMSQEEDPGFNP